MRWLCVAVVLLTSCAARAADGPPSRVESWIQLFDGETLFGWTSNNPDIPWKVVDGTITAGVPAGEKPPQGLLITDVPFADYELKCEFRLSPGGNSGVFLRTLEQPKVVDADCYEVNIADEHPQGYLTGSLVGRAKTAVPLKGSTRHSLPWAQTTIALASGVQAKDG